ncbi:hypothetical protein JK232_21920 [Nissabacter archeti]|uniref:General secretion pathway protein GspB n=1 Tax=Nissabacter archeti TaxID=1917880 RepID=A0ABS5JNU8_9GAMM|nr:hypothetical protein [Nissabacter archeti]MBS0971544.1 hypothetical protein [Nissabacter archeti]
MSFRLHQAMNLRLQGGAPAKLRAPFKRTCIKAGGLLLWGCWMGLFAVQGAYLHIAWTSRHPEPPVLQGPSQDREYTLSPMHYLFKTRPLPAANEPEAETEPVENIAEPMDDQAEAEDINEEEDVALVEEEADTTISKDDTVDPALKARVQQALAELEEDDPA